MPGPCLALAESGLVCGIQQDTLAKLSGQQELFLAGEVLVADFCRKIGETEKVGISLEIWLGR